MLFSSQTYINKVALLNNVFVADVQTSSNMDFTGLLWKGLVSLKPTCCQTTRSLEMQPCPSVSTKTVMGGFEGQLRVM